MLCRFRVALLVVCVGVLPAMGDPVLAALDPPDVEQGVAAYERGAYEEARALLREVVERRPARVHATRGAAAHWLGKAYRACGQPDSMRWAWRTGVAALEEHDRFDAPLYDAHLWAQWGEADARAEAADTYLSLLARAGPRLDERNRSVLRRHVAQLLPLLSARQAQQVVRASPSARTPLRLRAGAGDWLTTWWRSNDPLPATAANERVEEHLNRVRHATEHFPSDSSLAQFDDRGTLYVRYGAPSGTHTIPFMDLSFLREVTHLGVGVSPSDFPDNVIWKYPGVGERGSYLFVKTTTGYRLGTALDLFPEKLKGHYDASDRSQSRAYSSLAAMRYIYEHLAMHYRDPGNVYPEVVRYFNVQRAQQKSVLQRGQTEVGDGAGARQVYRGPGAPMPSEVANRNLRKAEQKERMFVRKREREMPTAYSTAATTETALPVRARLVRTLTKTGTTRVDVLWGGTLTDAGDPDGPQRLTASLVAYDDAYRRRNAKTSRHRMKASAGRPGVPFYTQTNTVALGDSLSHLAMQWDRYAVETRRGDATIGERTGRQSLRFDSLRTLGTDPDILEMSDLRPMILTKPPAEVAGRLSEAGRPYPFRAVSASASLLLGFEVYHLAFGADDQTRYTVEYEVVRRKERTGFFSFLRGDDETRTATASTYTGTGRRADEYILLEWGADPPESPQPATVTVRVTDETTGQTVERSIEFRLLPPGARVAGGAGKGGPPR